MELPFSEGVKVWRFIAADAAATGADEPMVVNPLFPFPDRLPSVFSALGEKANS
jgi:hypothetical protein